MKVTNKYVLFWGDIFSNFHQSPFEENGIIFLTNEQYFMYRKAMFFKDYGIAEEILQHDHPAAAKKLGRQISGFDSEKWSEVSEDIMKQGLRLKFSQNPDLKEKLVGYPNHTFVEASPYDKIWGIGLGEDDPRALDSSTWEGNNLLGYCLTEIRDEFINNLIK